MEQPNHSCAAVRYRKRLRRQTTAETLWSWQYKAADGIRGLFGRSRKSKTADTIRGFILLGRKSKGSSMFVHNVFFYLKDGTSDTTRDAIAQDARTLLAQIPGVRHIWAGSPAMIERDVIDNTYGVGLTVVFD